jgi:hypothetical protein
MAIITVYSKIQVEAYAPAFGDKTQVKASVNLLFGALKQLLSLLQFYQSSQEAIMLTESLVLQINRTSMLLYFSVLDRASFVPIYLIFIVGYLFCLFRLLII